MTPTQAPASSAASQTVGPVCPYQPSSPPARYAAAAPVSVALNPAPTACTSPGRDRTACQDASAPAINSSTGAHWLTSPGIKAKSGMGGRGTRCTLKRETLASPATNSPPSSTATVAIMALGR